MSEMHPRGSGMNKVAITAIIVAGIVTLACIAASAYALVEFFQNAPW